MSVLRRRWLQIFVSGLILLYLVELMLIGLGALDDDPHPAAVLVEEVLYVRRYGGVTRGGNRAVVGRLGHLALSLLAHVLDGDLSAGAASDYLSQVDAHLTRLAPRGVCGPDLAA